MSKRGFYLYIDEVPSVVKKGQRINYEIPSGVREACCEAVKTIIHGSMDCVDRVIVEVNFH